MWGFISTISYFFRVHIYTRIYVRIPEVIDVKTLILPYRNYELGVAAACMVLNHVLIK